VSSFRPCNASSAEAFDELAPFQISSIRIHGGATVIAFSDGNFSGRSVVFRHNVPDLRNYRVQGNDNKNWNNRISSIRIN
jgi:hypothetical protein